MNDSARLKLPIKQRQSISGVTAGESGLEVVRGFFEIAMVGAVGLASHGATVASLFLEASRQLNRLWAYILV